MSAISAESARRVGVVRDRIAAAERRAGRPEGSVRLVAVVKFVDAAVVDALVGAGVDELGESRADELRAHADELGVRRPGAVSAWHFVGRLQRNKIGRVATTASWWHSVDRDVLVEPLARHAPDGRFLVQVDLGGEEQKGGCAPEEAGELVAALADRHLAVVGLSTIPPREEDPRPYFAALRELGASLGLPELSMGMSGDYEAAIEEGATMVRVGRALAGPRERPDAELG